MKQCSKCGDHKALDEFNIRSDSRTGRASYCRVCHVARLQLRARERYERLLIPLLMGPCADCGIAKHPVSMEFDHIMTKHRGVAQLTMAKESVLLAEIAKCEVVCADCHNVRTATRNGSVVWVNEMIERFNATQH